MRDATRRKVEEALAEETEVLYLLMDDTQDGIYFKDAANRFTRINRAHARALGISDPRQALGRRSPTFSARSVPGRRLRTSSRSCRRAILRLARWTE